MMKRFSSLECLLSIISVLLLLCCVGLAVISWMSLRPAGEVEPTELLGRMVITEGAVFSEELRNSSSMEFKSLAFDVQKLVSEAFRLSELRWAYKTCQVKEFSEGSVAVTFDLWFDQLMDGKEAEQQLGVGLQQVEESTLVIDTKSITVTTPSQTTPSPPTTTLETSSSTTGFTSTTAVTCRPHFSPCADGSGCVPTSRFCDGVLDCSDASDEALDHCATPCDGQFELRGPSGSFGSSPEIHNSSTCRWIIRVESGQAVQVHVHQFEVDGSSGALTFYDGVGEDKEEAGNFPGFEPPGIVWMLTEQSTVEYNPDPVYTTSAFRASYSIRNISDIHNQEKLTCSFELGMCLWRRPQEDYEYWIRMAGPQRPPTTGPSVDHTLGNSSGFYIITPRFRGSYRIQSLSLTPPPQPMCLSFWYHMLGREDQHLRVVLLAPPPSPLVTVLFQRDGNYGDNWNYGQVTLNLTSEARVAFEALKNGGINNIALDDIKVTSEPCGPAPPDPTTVPPPTTPPPIPADCGGPFDLWETNSTFSSPNYPHSYGNGAKCMWTLHADPGQNIQLHFLDVSVQTAEDVVEVRDGAGDDSTLLAVLTGSDGSSHHLFSTANEMTVWFFTDSSGNSYRGFKANFTCGVGLGSAAPCDSTQFQCGTGLCIDGDMQCDGAADCPDASDEAECVRLQGNGSIPLQVQVGSTLFTVCADTWASSLSHLTCRYLGYRFGITLPRPAQPEDFPFAEINIRNGTLETSTNVTCHNVTQLTCNNQPCGVRQVTNISKELNQPDDNTTMPDDGRVVGGANAMKGAWPWMVSLHWMGKHVCGATLLGSDWLLTAAHCVYGKNTHLNLWTAVLGLHTQSEGYAEEVQTRRVDKVIMNMNYNRLTKQADIAMMHLEEPINFTQWVRPVCLPSEVQSLPAGRECFIAGWGRTAEGGYLPDILQEAKVPLVNETQCQEQLPEYIITTSMLCAGYTEGGVDSCQGDSGGPLMCEEDGHWTLIGVTSFGIGCGRPKRPGVYARVSAFSEWITQTRRLASPYYSSLSSYYSSLSSYYSSSPPSPVRTHLL